MIEKSNVPTDAGLENTTLIVSAAAFAVNFTRSSPNKPTILSAHSLTPIAPSAVSVRVTSPSLSVDSVRVIISPADASPDKAVANVAELEVLVTGSGILVTPALSPPTANVAVNSFPSVRLMVSLLLSSLTVYTRPMDCVIPVLPAAFVMFFADALEASLNLKTSTVVEGPPYEISISRSSSEAFKSTKNATLSLVEVNSAVLSRSVPM